VPIYEYVCQDCAYKFELKQSMKDEAVATCERCGKSVSRIISAPAIMFKGTGWYVTDYSDKMKPPTGESPKPSTEQQKDTPGSSTPTPAAPAPAAAAAPASSSTAASGASAATATSSSSSSSGSSSSST
jgi:putative FmdB family regulatory protein